ncbi:MAG: helicase HerA-like domain-containing protein [Polyangiales bacterium]
MQRPFELGAVRHIEPRSPAEFARVAPSHLVTHAVVTGMTGSGKTGLLTVLVEEALLSRIPVLVVDVKGDLANIGLACESLAPESLHSWIDQNQPDFDAERSPHELARTAAEERQKGLARWGLDEASVQRFARSFALRVLTPGSAIAEPIDLLSALRADPDRWTRSLDSARSGLSSAISLLLRLLDRDSDPIRSREHVLLSVLAEHQLRAGMPADLRTLIQELSEPSITTVGAMDVDDFLSKNKRRELASSLNAMLASPTFAAWREGSPIAPSQWLSRTPEGLPTLTIVSVAHLDEDSRAMVLGLLFDEVLSWVRTQSGTSSLRALLVMDEVYGWLPPHPKDPPTKKPLVSLMKQARAFGVGVVLATQNPMDLDYRALSNAGLWCIGRLQTDADRERVIEGLSSSDAGASDTRSLGDLVKALSPRWFVLRDVHSGPGCSLLQPRHALSWLKGPLTAEQLRTRAGR